MWANNVSHINPFNEEFAVKHACMLSCFPFQLCAMGALRTDAREKYNIEVSRKAHANYIPVKYPLKFSGTTFINDQMLIMANSYYREIVAAIVCWDGVAVHV